MVIKYITNFFKNKDRNYVLLTQVVNAIIALISGKLIAIFISPEDFGIYSIQWATFIFFSTLLITPFVQFIKSTENTILPKIGSSQYLVTGIGVVAISLVLLTIFLYFYYGNLDSVLFIILLLLMPIYTINFIVTNFFNIQNKLIAYSKQSISITGGGLVFLLIYFGLGLAFFKHSEVLWMVQLVGGAIGFCFFLSKYRFLHSKFKIAYSTFLKKYLRFAWPLMFMSVWAWANNYFDRYAIEYFLSLKEVGLYNASYSVGSKFFLMLCPIFIVLVTPTIYSGARLKVKKKIMLKYGTYYFVLAVPVLLTVYFLKDYIGGLLLSENYRDGFFIIFWIALAFFIFTLAQLYELILYAELKTKIILFGYMISAFVNVTLNVILIPKIGISGAAIATCIGFTVHLLIIYYNSRKL